MWAVRHGVYLLDGGESVMRHRIIQIAAASCASDVSAGCDSSLVSSKLYALCEDGSLWERELQPYSGRPEWTEIPSPEVERRRAVEAAR